MLRIWYSHDDYSGSTWCNSSQKIQVFNFKEKKRNHHLAQKL